MKRIEVVAAVVQSDGRVLCVQRGPNPRAYIAGKWEFPGGKIEPGEDHAAALLREIEEELRIPIHVAEHFLTVEHAYPDFAIRMHAYLCHLIEPAREVVLTEHTASCWASPVSSGFAALDWAAADVPIVQLLRDRAGRG